MNMKTFCRWLALGCASSLLVTSCATPGSETGGKLVSLDPNLPFPPKPGGLTNRPTICQPVFIMPESLSRSLGGTEITNMVVPALGNMLVNAGRFTLTYASQHDYECRVALNDLTITQHDRRSAAGIGEIIIKFLTGLLKISVNNQPAKVDWSKNEVDMSVDCGVSLQIIDVKKRNVLAGGDGRVKRTDTTKNIQLEVLGANFGQSNTVTKLIAIESRLVQLAFYHALTSTVVQVDRELANTVKVSKPPRPTLEEQLERLEELYRLGMIDAAKYQSEKQKVLQKFQNPRR